MFENLTQNIKTFFVSLWQKISSFFVMIGSKVSGFVVPLWTKIRTFLSPFWQRVGLFLSENWKRIRTFLSPFWRKVGSLFVSGWTKVRTYLSPFWRAVNRLLVSGWSKVKTFCAPAWERASAFCKMIWGKIHEFGLSVWQKYIVIPAQTRILIWIIALALLVIFFALVNIINLIKLKDLKKVSVVMKKTYVVQPEWRIVLMGDGRASLYGREYEHNEATTYVPPANSEAVRIADSDEEKNEDEAWEVYQPVTEEDIEKMIEPEDALSIVGEDGEVTETIEKVDYQSGMALVSRYRKSFTAKLIQSKDEAKVWYTALKNGFLSYKKVKSRVSWNYDSINSGRKKIAKFAVRGKTLCVYFALDPNEYIGTKYKVEAVDSKKYQSVPCLYRIKNPRRFKYAMELFGVIAERYGLKRIEEQDENYYLPYESTEALLERGLIKKVLVKESIDDFMHKRDVAIKAAEERGDLDTSEEYTFNRSKDSVEEVRSINPFTGIAFVNIYNKSFMTEINQAPVQTKTYYNELKNELLSYQWTKGETNVDRSNVVNNRLIVAKLEVENDTLVTYFALNPNNFKGVQTASGEKYRTTPLKFFVRNDEDAERAKSFVAVLAEKFGKGRDAHHKDMMFVDESDSANSKATAKTEHDFKTQGDASVCEEFGMLYYLDEVENMHQDEVSATVADEMIHDEVAFTLVEHLRRDGKRSGKKCIVNIDTISSRFEKGDLVNLETMKKKGIIAKNIGYVKVLARGKLNKPLTIEAQDFSMAAVKMVVLTGGTAREV